MNHLSLTETLDALKSGDVTSGDLVRRALAAADDVDDVLGSFVTRYDEAALRAADLADLSRRAGKVQGSLHGIPIGVKDILSTSEGVTTSQSVVPDPGGMGTCRVDATAVRRLREAGAILLAKTTSMEFSIGMPDQEQQFPAPRNPWDLSHWAGGSSSGSGSAVAAGLVLGALGTDTAASIRMPAAYCGVSGMKPTFGLVPRSGCVPLAYSLDHVGPMGRTADDCALLLEAIAGYDSDDPYSARAGPSARNHLQDGRVDGVRIGFDLLSRVGEARRDPSLDAVFNDALRELEDLGAELVPVEVPAYTEMSTAVQVILLAEAFAYHRHSLRTRWQDYGRSTRRRLGLGAGVSASDYVDAQRARRVGRAALAKAFVHLDAIVTPTAAAGAPQMSPVEWEDGGMNLTYPVFTAYWNLMGNPAISIPMGHTAGGLPLGLQIVGKHFEDGKVLGVASAYQAVTDWHRRTPPANAPRTNGRARK